MIATKRKSSPPAPTAPGQSRALWALLCLLITFLLTGTRAEAFFAAPQPAPGQIAPAAQESTGKTTTAWQYDALDSLIAANSAKPKLSAKERRAQQQADAKEKKHGDADYEGPASEDYAKWKAKELEKAEGKDARRAAHDKKRDGIDRSKRQLDEDYDE